MQTLPLPRGGREAVSERPSAANPGIKKGIVKKCSKQLKSSAKSTRKKQNNNKLVQ